MNSMYIHIPFCKSICSYCDFCKQLYIEKNVDTYLDAIKEEINDRYNDTELETIYIGGGTPSCLNKEQLNKLFDIISSLRLNKLKEFTFECTINDINEELIIFLKKNKVNRLSIGVESFNKNKLMFMERNANYDDVKNKIDMIKNTGITNINIDLMYAIPNESLKDLKRDLSLILKLKVNHISTYSLILEEYTKLKLSNIKSIDEDLEFEMYNYIRKKLKSKKYRHYEVSNYAIDGYESFHNINYWKNEEYYGFGLGAHGYIDGIRYENTKNIDKYLRHEFVSKQEIVGNKEKKENELMLGFRMVNGINIKDFSKKYKENIEDVFPIKPLIKNKDLILKNDNLFINPDKLYIMNEILLKLF